VHPSLALTVAAPDRHPVRRRERVLWHLQAKWRSLSAMSMVIHGEVDCTPYPLSQQGLYPCGAGRFLSHAQFGLVRRCRTHESGAKEIVPPSNASDPVRAGAVDRRRSNYSTPRSVQSSRPSTAWRAPLLRVLDAASPSVRMRGRSDDYELRAGPSSNGSPIFFVRCRKARFDKARSVPRRGTGRVADFVRQFRARYH